MEQEFKELWQKHILAAMYMNHVTIPLQVWS